MAPEPGASADELLPQPGLRFMETERRRLAHRGPEMGGVDALVVQAVTDFMEQHEEPGRDIPPMIADRDADIAAQHGGECGVMVSASAVG